MKQDFTGKRFGRLVVLSDSGKRAYNGSVIWECLCDCGNHHFVSAFHLKNGGVRSCGCLKFEANKTHGLTKDPLYKTWGGMKQRCYSVNHEHYPLYGGRGISICKEWKDDFKAFYDWAMGNGWNKTLEVDRIDNDGNYTPDNCRLVNRSTNCRNRRNAFIVCVGGENISLADACDKRGLRYATVHARITRYGYTAEQALSPLDFRETRSAVGKMEGV